MPTINDPLLNWDATQNCFVDDTGTPVKGNVSICMGDGSDMYEEMPAPVDTDAVLEDLMDEFVGNLLEEDEEDDSKFPFNVYNNTPPLVESLRYGVYTIDDVTEAFKNSLLKLGPE